MEEEEEEVERWRKRDVAPRDQVLGFLSVPPEVGGSDPDLCAQKAGLTSCPREVSCCPGLILPVKCRSYPSLPL